jgi:hypothetical protein
VFLATIAFATKLCDVSEVVEFLESIHIDPVRLTGALELVYVVVAVNSPHMRPMHRYLLEAMFERTRLYLLP